MRYTANFNLKKPDYTDIANISDINANMDAIDIELNHTKKARNNVATEFSEEIVYSKGDLATYDYELYQCNIDMTESGQWVPENWTKITLGYVLNPLINKIDGLRAFIADEYNEENAYAKDDLVWYNNKVYKCAVENTIPGIWSNTDWQACTLKDILATGGASNNDP